MSVHRHLFRLVFDLRVHFHDLNTYEQNICLISTYVDDVHARKCVM